MNDLISIIIPMYNSEDYIEETVKSIQNQSYKNIEIIIIDDYSIDNSFNIIKDLAKKDKRIKLYKNNMNLGIGASRNYGIDISKGRYIRFVDSDDLLPKFSTEIMLYNMKKYSVPIVIGVANLYWDKNKTEIPKSHKKIYSSVNMLIEDPSSYIALGENAGVWNKLYDKKFLITNNIKSPNEHLFAQDIPFTFKIYLTAKKIFILKNNEIVYYWRVRKGSISRSEYSDKYIRDRLKVSNMIEDFIINNNLENKPLSMKIRKRNISSIIKIIKSSINNFKYEHFKVYKKQLIDLKKKGFNIFFGSNDVMKQIIFIIITSNYTEAIEQIPLVVKNKKKTGITFYEKMLIYFNIKKLKPKINITSYVEIEKFQIMGESISIPNNKKDYFSNWTNNDSIFFKIKNFKKGTYFFVFEYSWNSNKSLRNYRLGCLSFSKGETKDIIFYRTNSWKKFEKIKVSIKNKIDLEECIFQLRSINHKGVGFINLKKIYLKRI